MTPAKENKVNECVYPNRHSCRGCEHSLAPELFDGGCKLMMKNKNGGQNMNERAKEIRREYKREWNRKNKDKVKAAQERYWNKKAQEQTNEPR